KPGTHFNEIVISPTGDITKVAGVTKEIFQSTTRYTYNTAGFILYTLQVSGLHTETTLASDAEVLGFSRFDGSVENKVLLTVNMKPGTHFNEIVISPTGDITKVAGVTKEIFQSTTRYTYNTAGYILYTLQVSGLHTETTLASDAEVLGFSRFDGSVENKVLLTVNMKPGTHFNEIVISPTGDITKVAGVTKEIFQSTTRYTYNTAGYILYTLQVSGLHTETTLASDAEVLGFSRFDGSVENKVLLTVNMKPGTHFNEIVISPTGDITKVAGVTKEIFQSTTRYTYNTAGYILYTLQVSGLHTETTLASDAEVLGFSRFDGSVENKVLLTVNMKPGTHFNEIVISPTGDITKVAGVTKEIFQSTTRYTYNTAGFILYTLQVSGLHTETTLASDAEVLGFSRFDGSVENKVLLTVNMKPGTHFNEIVISPTGDITKVAGVTKEIFQSTTRYTYNTAGFILYTLQVSGLHTETTLASDAEVLGFSRFDGSVENKVLLTVNMKPGTHFNEI